MRRFLFTFASTFFAVVLCTGVEVVAVVFADEVMSFFCELILGVTTGTADKITGDFEADALFVFVLGSTSFAFVAFGGITTDFSFAEG